MRILNHTPQEDGCSIQQYYPKLWASVWRICAQLVVWDNLWSQIFHRSKIDARGSIRKALNVISWTTPNGSLSSTHGMPSHRNIIRSWGARLRRSKNEFKNVLPAVSALGWERCPWTDDTFANKRIFLGAGARAGDDAWKTRLTVT